MYVLNKEVGLDLRVHVWPTSVSFTEITRLRARAARNQYVARNYTNAHGCL
jgi:hypothetical protein